MNYNPNSSTANSIVDPEEHAKTLAEKQEFYKSLRENDQKLYETWKTNPSKHNLGNLIESLSGPIYAEVRRQSGTLPTVALASEAKKWAFKAIQTYDPSKGASLSTHVQGYLQRVRRTNYKFQNAVRLPENMQLKFNEYNHQLAMLTDELNREPTDEELANRLGWSKPKTVKFKNSLYADLIESGTDKPSEVTQFSDSAILMEHLMSKLDPQEKFILENSKVLSSTELSRRLGVNLNRLNYLKSKLIDKIKMVNRDSGLM